MSECFVCAKLTTGTFVIGATTWSLCAQCQENKENKLKLLADGPLTRLNCFGEFGVLPGWMAGEKFRLSSPGGMGATSGGGSGSGEMTVTIDASRPVRLVKNKCDIMVPVTPAAAPAAAAAPVKEMQFASLIAENVDVFAVQNRVCTINVPSQLPNAADWLTVNETVADAIGTQTVVSTFF